jgi:hypothetical protein
MRAIVGGLRAWGPPMPVPKRGGAIRGMPRFRFREPTCLRCFPFIRVRNSPRVLECLSSCSCRGLWVGVGSLVDPLPLSAHLRRLPSRAGASHPIVAMLRRAELAWTTAIDYPFASLDASHDRDTLDQGCGPCAAHLAIPRAFLGSRRVFLRSAVGVCLDY